LDTLGVGGYVLKVYNVFIMTLYIYLGVYIAVILLMSYFVGKKNTSEDFLMAGRDRSWIQIMTSKFAATVGMSSFIAYTAYAYQYGFAVIYLFVAIIISYTFFAIWAVPKIFKDNKKNRTYTHGHWVGEKLKSVRSKKISDWFIIIQALLWYLTAIIGGGKTLEFLNILSYEYAVILTSTIVLLYVLLAGFKVVILTDIIQAGIIFFLMVLILFNLPVEGGLQSLADVVTDSMPISLIVGFFIYGSFSIFSSTDRFLLIFASKTPEDAKKGMLFSIIPTIIMMFMLLLVGIFIYSQNPGLDPDLAFLELFRYLPETLFSLAAVMLFAGLMSSADTNVYLISSFLAMINNRDNTIQRTRIFSVGLVIFGILFAMVFPTVLGVTVFAAGFSLISSVAMIYVIAGGRSKKKFFASFFAAVIGFVVGLMTVGIDPSIAVFPVIFGSLGLCLPERFLGFKNNIQ
jgi:SSS family solute:Na+ symporter